MSAMAHGKGEPEIAISIATAAVAGCRGLDDERAMLYFDLIGLSLGDAARAAFEGLMAQGNYEFQSDFAKKYLAEGKAKGEAHAVLTVLDARGIEISEPQKERIRSCSDEEVINRWLRKAVSIRSAEELFNDL